MGNLEHDKILAFDTLFTNNQIQKLKIIMPFFDASKQKHIAIYIKYLELQYTIAYLKKNPFTSFPPCSDVESICHDLKPYCSPAEKKKVEQMETAFSNMKNYQEMIEMITMMKDIFPSSDGEMNPDILSGLFGSDAGQMFEMFSALNNAQ